MIRFALAAQGGGFEAPGPEDFWQPLIGDGAFAITRPAVVFALSVALISAVLLIGTRRLSVVPTKGQFALEGLYGLVRNGIARDIIGSHDFLRFLPLLFSMFVLILVNNLFGVTPVIQYPTMSRIAFPIALTLIVFGVYHFIGLRKKGGIGYLKSMVPPGLPIFIVPFIFLLEVVTYFVTRPLTLALRLFANMFAGHLLLLVFVLGAEHLLLHGGPLLKVASAGSFVLALVFTAFEILVEFLQAYIFTLLAALYIAGSIADEH